MKSSQPNIFKIAGGIGITLSAITMNACVNNPTYQQPGQQPSQYPLQYPNHQPNYTPQVVTNDRGIPSHYLVQAGDSVSKIAERYGIDYRQIAALNNLDSRYTIYVGQWLRLWGNDSVPSYNYNNQNTNLNYNPVITTPTQGLDNTYQSPTTNPIIRNFNHNNGTAGVWFSGNEGDPVLASLQGTVIYSDNGLSEYGNLVLVRHDDTNVTAYAHNKENLVKEGDLVRKGQRIATMGRTGYTGQNNPVALEFQLRQNGSPIDPLTKLQ